MMDYRGHDYNDDSAAKLLRSVRQQVSYIFVFLCEFSVIGITSNLFWLMIVSGFVSAVVVV